MFAEGAGDISFSSGTTDKSLMVNSPCPSSFDQVSVNQEVKQTRQYWKKKETELRRKEIGRTGME